MNKGPIVVFGLALALLILFLMHDSSIPTPALPQTAALAASLHIPSTMAGIPSWFILAVAGAFLLGRFLRK